MRLGIVGFGNMGQAFSICLSKKIGKENVVVHDIDAQKRSIAVENGFPFASDLKFLVDNSDVILIAVKPKDGKEVLEKLKDIKGKIIVSIMAGVSIEAIENIVGKDKKIVRLMPNIGVAVSSGTIAITDNGKLTEEERKQIEDIFLSCGRLYEIDEKLFDSFTAIAGSSPAFILSFIDALSLAGVREGFPYNQALNIVLDTVLGTVKVLKEFGGNPNEWITKVTSPGGTTIEGIKHLESEGFKGIVMECIEKTSQKAKKLK